MVSRRFTHLVRMSLAWPKVLRRLPPGKIADRPKKVRPLPGMASVPPGPVKPWFVARIEEHYQKALRLWRESKLPREEVFERYVEGKLVARRVKVLPPKRDKQFLRLLISLALLRKKLKRLRPDLYPLVGLCSENEVNSGVRADWAGS